MRPPDISALSLLAILLAALPFNVKAQSTSSNNADPTSTASAFHSVITTTILSALTPTASGASPTTSSQILTLTLNATLLAATNTSALASLTVLPNGTTLYPNSALIFPNGTTLLPNGTYIDNTTSTISSPYNGTSAAEGGVGAGILPFEVRIWPGYAVVGVVLMFSGGFVGVLGGKHRWSSMAIVSGYSLMLFTLIMILRFGVLPPLAPPSPTYPSSTTIGLYALALLISSIIGSAIGLFWWNATKFWVPAVGGWAMGWWVLGLKTGGVVGESVLGRWGLMTGFMILAFILGLIPSIHPHALLLSTAFIGSTAFVLGIDCFARAGLKEFYVYNLGFEGLFPKLNGYGYPLLVNMQVELGVIAACFLVGAAIQYRVLGLLHVKLKQIQKEDRARRDAEESKRAAQRFKHVQGDLDQWEEKHGSGAGRVGGGIGSTKNLLGGSTAELDTLPTLAGDRGRRDSSAMSHLGGRSRGENGYEYDDLSRHSPSNDDHDFISSLGPRAMSAGPKAVSADRQSVGPLPTMQFGDKLAPALGVETLTDPKDADEQERQMLLAEIADTRKSIDYLRSTTPTSMLRMPDENDQSRRQSMMSTASGSRLSFCNPPHSTGLDTTTAAQKQAKDWDRYVAERKLFTPPAGVSAPVPASARESSFGRLSRISAGVLDAVEKRERTRSAYELGSMAEFGDMENLSPRPGIDRRSSSFEPLSAQLSPPANWQSSMMPIARSLTPPADIGYRSRPTSLHDRNAAYAQPQGPKRELTYEDLNERHRSKIGKMQRPVTEELEERMALAESKAHYEQVRDTERKTEAWKEGRRQSSGLGNAPGAINGGVTQVSTMRRAKSSDGLTGHPGRVDGGIDEAAEWRQSVAMSAAPKVDSSAPGGPIPFPSPEKKRPRRTSRGPNQFIN